MPNADSTTTDTPEGTTSEAQGDENALGAAGKRALQAERDARAVAERTAAQLQARLNDIEAAGLSDLERAQREAQEAKDALAALQADSARTKVALAKGLTAELAARLRGTTEDELAADADALKALFPASTTTTPKADPTQGGSGTSTAGGTPREQFADALDGLL